MGYQFDINQILHPIAAMNKANGVTDGKQMNGDPLYADNVSMGTMSMGTMLVSPQTAPVAAINQSSNVADRNGTLLTTGSRS